MSNTPLATLEKLNQRGTGLRVDFYAQGDRLHHTVSMVRDGQATVVWQSVEGDDHAPAFQELHQQTDRQGNPLLFLQGAAGGAQWSMSVQQDDKAITLDVAARVTGPPAARVIEYQQVSNDAPTIACDPLVGTRQTDEPNTRMQLLPASGEAALPTTLQWKYGFL